MKHADKLIYRIRFLDGLPNVECYNMIQIGQTVKQHLTLDLSMERDAITGFNEAIELSRSTGDNGSREMLEGMLVSEESTLIGSKSHSIHQFLQNRSEPYQASVGIFGATASVA